VNTPSLNDEQWLEQEQFLAKFANGWKPDRILKVEDYLPPSGLHRLPVLVELVHTDVEFRTQANLPVVVGWYLERFPELASVENIAEELVAAHIELLLLESKTTLPQTLGSYELIKEVGRGSTSVVYEGRDRRDGRQVAIKVLRGWVGQEPVLVRRFAREVSLSSRLRHPGLAVAEEFGCDSGVCFLVSQFVEGVPLSQWALDSKTTEAVTEVFCKIGAAIGHAHSQGVSHHDLSSTNVLVRCQGLVLG
jgi:predicted Ser/Thr protein kinase